MEEGCRKPVLGVCALEFAHEGCKNTIRESALKVDRTKGEGAREGGGGVGRPLLPHKG